MTAETVPLDQITIDPHNANKHSERGEFFVRQSMQKFGYAEAGTLDAKNRLVSGNLRTEIAADVLDAQEAIVIDVDGKKPVYIRRADIDLDTPEGRELAIALNRSAEVSITWDTEVLQDFQLAGIELGDWFNSFELSDLGIDGDGGAGETADAEAQVSRADELREEWGTELGQLWRLPSRDGKGEHRLICGDCTDAAVIELLMGGDKADCTVTDPPYGVGVDYGSFEDTADNVRDLIKRAMPVIYNYLPAAFTPGVPAMWDYPKPAWVGAWVHPAPVGSCPWGFVGNNPILYYGNDPYLKRGKGRRPDCVVMASDRQGEEGHPTPKPIKVWEWLVERLTPEKGMVVFDPFGGSGTTMVACEGLGRYCRMVELSPAYCAVILQRMADIGLTPQLVE